MTTEEKAKAYDKAVKQAEKEILAYGNLNCDAARQIFRLFPHLKMSEDERTRAQIVKICDEWLKGNPSARPCLNDVALLKNLLNRLKTVMECGEGIYYLHKDGSITCIGRPATEEQPTDTEHTNVESDYDKGYREGHRFGLKQTQDYMIGKTFKGLIPCWINAPSTLNPLHQYHGKNAVVMHENNGGFRCICIDENEPVSFHIPSGDVLVEGWKKKPTAWSKEDEDTYNRVYCLFRDAIDEWYKTIFLGCYPKITKDKVLAMLKSLRPQSHWKPSEEQINALEDAKIRMSLEGWGICPLLQSLINDLKKL